MSSFRLGTSRIAWRTDVRVAAKQAAACGFDFLDVFASDMVNDLALPVGLRFAALPTAGCAWPAPGERADWTRETDRLRSRPGPVVEPWAGSLFGSDDAVHRLVEEVPDVGVVLDVGHVTAWGGDVGALLPYAVHVQLRQASVGHAQLAAADGTVNFGAIVEGLRDLGYTGGLSIEYFDLPRFGWPMADPVGETIALAELVRPLLG